MNIFAKAAEVLMEKGHHKGDMRNGKGAVCAIGALCDAAGNSEQAVTLADQAAEYLGMARFPSGTLHALARWNDAPERTAEDVILLFKELAVEEGS
ncbi:DUF6197 family protein [Streptomyces roseolus]|uniref:DUF6197 family protein n=1 Tax=Streptomyces roseolus TaxID=67358 RepID=UPI001672323E|nr:hypothetical protein [Streptomyces roseolus]GGR51529.1 hypothetical protein GCM10010282_50550 [Streptomyces roseolus]